MSDEAASDQRRARAAGLSWLGELIDLSRPLTVETVDALFGDIVADGRTPIPRRSAPRSPSTTRTRVAYSCLVGMPDHIATHVDAPIHAVAGRRELEDVDISRLIGDAVVLDLDRGGARLRLHGRRPRGRSIPMSSPATSC